MKNWSLLFAVLCIIKIKLILEAILVYLFLKLWLSGDFSICFILHMENQNTHSSLKTESEGGPPMV
jgi:hypothetical protein